MNIGKKKLQKPGAKSKLYETIKEVGELKADQIRLNLNQQPETEVVKGIVENETENSVLLKFKRFKRWARENIIGISAIAISIAGVMTTVVIGGKNAAKKGTQSLKKFAKSVYNTGEKFGPVISALGTLLSKVLALSAKELLWL